MPWIMHTALAIRSRTSPATGLITHARAVMLVVLIAAEAVFYTLVSKYVEITPFRRHPSPNARTGSSHQPITASVTCAG